MIDVRLKRIYETPDDGDGRRYLVERLWPRGVSKERARLAGWLTDAAPSAELRRWYDHDPAKWPEFRLRYFSELEAGRESLAPSWPPRKKAVSPWFSRRKNPPSPARRRSRNSWKVGRGPEPATAPSPPQGVRAGSPSRVRTAGAKVAFVQNSACFVIRRGAILIAQ